MTVELDNKIHMTEVEDPPPPPDMQAAALVNGGAVGGPKLINDGLLCNIAMSMSSFPNKDDFVAQVERVCDISEIMEARRKLFTHYYDAICPENKELILGIKRQTPKKFILDIVNQMMKIDKTGSDMNMFCMPWNYKLRLFESDSENLCKTMEKEMSNELDMKIEALEKRLNEKNRLLHSSIVESVNKAIAQVPSYAGIAGAAGHQTGAIPKILVQEVGGQAGGVGDRVRTEQGGRLTEGGVRTRTRSESNKRRRGNDGEPIAVQDEREKVEKAGQRRAQKPCVVGTAGVTAGRKMRAPPADIFVWGVHPDTTLEDIVNDLAASEIKIETKDIEKKSKEGSYLDSYKVSVPADDLTKALNPEIWPLRVKVREFIHYRRNHAKNGQQGGQQRGQQDGQQGAQQGQRQQNYGQHPHAGGQYAQGQPGHVQPSHGQGPQGQQPQAGGHPVHANFYNAVNSVGQQQQQQQLYPNLSNMFGVLSGPEAPNPNL